MARQRCGVGFGEPPKPTGRRRVLPIAIGPKAKPLESGGLEGRLPRRPPNLDYRTMPNRRTD